MEYDRSDETKGRKPLTLRGRYLLHGTEVVLATAAMVLATILLAGHPADGLPWVPVILTAVGGALMVHVSLFPRWRASHRSGQSS